MNLTTPSASSKAWERKRDALSASLHAIVDKLPPRKREAAIDRASIPSISYETYRSKGRRKVRKARLRGE